MSVSNPCQPPPYCGECDGCTGKHRAERLRQTSPLELTDRDFIAVARRRVADYKRATLWGRRANAAVLATVIEVLIERLERKR